MEFELNQKHKYFLNVGIIEAKHLLVKNENTIIAKINVGKHEKQVEAKTKKTENPYFNETFRFEFFEKKENFLMHRLRLSIYKTKCHKFVGLCDIELMSIWEQFNHQYYHKWAQLTDPRDVWSELKGYLKCDIQIIPEGYSPSHHIEENGDEIEKNLLVPIRCNFRRQNGIFTINIYKGDSIKFQKKKCGKYVDILCQNLYVKINFAGQSAKTKVVNKSETPSWNQGLHFVEAIPSLFQTILIELWDKKENCFIGSSQLNLKDIGNLSDAGILPTFGPSFIHLYNNDGPNNMLKSYRGRILISLRCQSLDRAKPTKYLKSTNISPLDHSLEPKHEAFTLFVGISQCLFLKKSYSKKCSFSLNDGAISSKEINKSNSNGHFEHVNEFIELENFATIDQYYSWWNKGLMPFSIQTIICSKTYDREYQNNSIKFYMNDILNLLNNLKVLIETRKNKKSIEMSINILRTMKKYCHEIISLPSLINETNLDNLKKENFKKIMNKINEVLDIAYNNSYGPTEIESMIRMKVELILNQLNEQPTFPSIEIALIKRKKLKLSQIILNPAKVLFSHDYKQSGTLCGKFQTGFFRNSRGEEVVALDAFVWLGRKVDFPYCFQSLKLPMDDNVLNAKNIEFDEEHIFEIRAHIYQGRLNPGSDASGLADPFVRVIAFDQIRETQVKAQTLDPFWDETLVFSSIKLYGSKSLIKTQSICIIFEVLDYDEPNNVELIGRAALRPGITFGSETYLAPKLKKEFVYNHGEATGEILIALELIERKMIHQNLNVEPAGQLILFSIPEDIRPHFFCYKVEAIIWGIRNYNSKTLPPYPKILVCIECNGVKVESSLARANKNFNFQFQILAAELNIPIEKEYSPPVSFSMYEFNYFDRPKYQGGFVLANASKFQVKYISHFNYKKILEVIKNINLTVDPEIDENPDWWTKFYASKSKNRKTRLIKIYENELEKQPYFDNFEDFLHLIRLIRGKTNVRSSQADFEVIGTLKCALAYYSSAEIPKNGLYFGPCPYSEPLSFTVYVYIVAAYNLTATDINGRCDPYILLSLGKNKISDRKNYIYKDVNPIFGKCYEFKGTFPWDNFLKISVMDHDSFLKDDLIGQTYIDIENRFYTKHRALCGISDTYETSGYCKWRDLLEPSEILEQICLLNNLEPPRFDEDSIIFGNESMPIHGKNKEDIALSILKDFHEVCGTEYHIVPEHIETRYLYHPENPEIDQGKIEMWVDIFAGHSGIPKPVDITPRKPEKYQLRVIVWCLTNVILSDVSWLSGEKCSDIYVKGWLSNPEESQRTDIHYRSLTGEGNFNWRFIFPFVYSPAEHKMITYKKMPFSRELWTEKIPCTLQLQVWDNDLLTDDFLGSLSLDMWDMPNGTKLSRNCDIKNLKTATRCSLFKLKKIRGWWPIRASGSTENEKVLSGKIDLELELLTENEAKQNPAGLGREGPHPLPEPRRPSSSFVWSFSPLPFLKLLAFRDLRRTIFYTICITAIVAFMISGWLAVPTILLQKLI